MKGVEEVGITYKEYVWLVKPNDIIETFCGGVYGCPIEYGISNKGFDCLPDVKKMRILHESGNSVSGDCRSNQGHILKSV